MKKEKRMKEEELAEMTQSITEKMKEELIKRSHGASLGDLLSVLSGVICCVAVLLKEAAIDTTTKSECHLSDAEVIEFVKTRLCEFEEWLTKNEEK